MKTLISVLMLLVVICAGCESRKDRLTVDLGNGATMEFVFIPAGKFVMGSPSMVKILWVTLGSDEGTPEEKPAHQVKISKGFYMSVTEVTQAQCKAVMGKNPSHFKGDDLPVDSVSWDNAVEFCKRLSEKQGKNCRLPTEAEWEYACRAGSTTRYCFGDDANSLAEYAWYRSNSDGRTHPVGQKKPNAFRLYDTHGNVDEWCQDWHYPFYYGNTPYIDPQGPSSGMHRVLRGGAWHSYASNCRVASRSSYSAPDYPDSRSSDHGLRVVLDPN